MNEDFADETNEKSLLSRIPLLAGSESKSKYLSYRATGFGVNEAAQLADIEVTTVQQWRKTDSVFKSIEQSRLQELQREVANDVLHLGFMRNMRLMLEYDQKIIWKMFNDPDEMEPHERTYFHSIRKHYTPSDLLSLSKAVEPERHNDSVTINLSWGGNDNITFQDNIDDKLTEDGEFKELNAGS